MPVAKRWGTLYTAPIYLSDNSTFTVGFEGTKKGSVANGWLQYGKTSGQSNDKREDGGVQQISHSVLRRSISKR